MNKANFLFGIICSLLMTEPARSQGAGPAKHLQPQDYGQWEKIQLADVSPDGGSISYTSKNGQGRSTWFVSQVRDGKVLAYPNSRSGKFLDFKNRLIYQVDDSLFIRTNGGSPVREVNGVRRYQSLQGGRFLLTCTVDFYADELKTFKLIDTEKWNEQVVKDVRSFAVSPQEDKVAFFLETSQGYSFMILNPQGDTVNRQVITKKIINNSINWSQDGNSLLFVVSNGQQPDAFGYILDVERDERLQMLSFSDIAGWKGVKRPKISLGYPRFTQDKKSILAEFEWVIDSAEKQPESPVEIWSQRAKTIFPYVNSLRDHHNRTKFGRIDLVSASFSRLQREEEKHFFIGPADQFAIALDFSPYEPAYLHKGNFYDLHLVDLQTNQRDTLAAKLSSVRMFPIFVESMNAVIYPEDDRLILRKLENAEKIVLNRNLPNPLTDCGACHSGVAISTDGNAFYMFDAYDLWRVSKDGQEVKRLTFGRDTGIEYRFSKSVYRNSAMAAILEVDEKEGIYLDMEIKPSRQTGFAKWTPKKGVEQIVFGDKRYHMLSVLPQGKGYVYMQEKFDESPAIVWRHPQEDLIKKLASSNVQQAEYHWGHAEMVYYHTLPDFKQVLGRKQNGALFYPADYQPGKKYPLIVSIYEDNTYMLHEYHNPGPSSFLDFNPTDYTLDGYFVLNPNLKPRDPSNPGHSMLENLKAAVEYMKGTGMIDEDRIGIYGHSFGGYEALFAATQMDDFATIVTGAAITDLVTDYFSHRKLLDGPSFYRTDWMQHAMKRNYFEIPELFHANSPFHHLDKIKSPVLLWTGKDDENVGWEQSVQFYLGMLRLQKDCTLLVYPGEDHVLFNPQNLKDLDDRMKQWFGHFLKGGPRQHWMEAPLR